MALMEMYFQFHTVILINVKIFQFPHSTCRIIGSMRCAERKI